VSGKIVMPGIIDTHVHLSSWLGGRFGHKMLAISGVTTAFDFAGPIDSVLRSSKKYGKGLNICALNYVRPEYTIKTTNPNILELEELLINSLNKGALGYKLLGGHYPLTPDGTSRAIEVANKYCAYVAFHAGTTESESNILGMKEAINLASGNSVHLAHINSYCRGQINNPVSESIEALNLLKLNKNIISESYLSPYNGTSANCKEGIPDSHVTRKCLEIKGYDISEDGLEEAIMDGYANISMPYGGINKLIAGQEGVNYWKQNNKTGTISFSINPGVSRYLIATEKNNDNQFTVNAFSSDGGGIPRNEILFRGLSLVKFGSISLNEFCEKSSFNPSRMVGLINKGVVDEGYDADLVVIDYESQEATMTIVNGLVNMYKGFVIGKGSNFITTKQGEKHVIENGLNPYIINLENSLLYSKVLLSTRHANQIVYLSRDSLSLNNINFYCRFNSR
jgi:hypothetical protein